MSSVDSLSTQNPSIYTHHYYYTSILIPPPPRELEIYLNPLDPLKRRTPVAVEQVLLSSPRVYALCPIYYYNICRLLRSSVSRSRGVQSSKQPWACPKYHRCTGLLNMFLLPLYASLLRASTRFLLRYKILIILNGPRAREKKPENLLYCIV